MAYTIGLDYGTVAGRIAPNKATFRRTATDDSITEALGNYMGWEVYRHE
jgi:hypothetical protein